MNRKIQVALVVLSMGTLALTGCYKGQEDVIVKDGRNMEINYTGEIKEKIEEQNKLLIDNPKTQYFKYISYGELLKQRITRGKEYSLLELENYGNKELLKEKSREEVKKISVGEKEKVAIIDLYESEELGNYIEACREAQINGEIPTDELSIISSVVDGYAISYNPHLSNNREIYKSKYYPEFVIGTNTRDFSDSAYEDIANQILTPGFLPTEMKIVGEYDCLKLGNSMEVAPFYIRYNELNDEVRENIKAYNVPARVRYEVYLNEDKSIEKTKVYMVKQPGNDIGIEEMGPLQNIGQLVGGPNEWKTASEEMLQVINKDRQGKTKGKIGKWEYAINLLHVQDEDKPYKESYIEIIIKP